ncbi:potassium transporter Kup [Aromatoleum aromaticum]|uniref:Probable potassium transport system protein Kup n=1 Tax=Aromatoleum aromaticum (strain DSM 19018 / LMG 30748 / EbN1) TaxID=76114 RepID=KUP_AROAE|nr:potassium transporter Kup [Aromatoleum aromaticum]Q5P3E3.1 RecName: Full=Probable potassium transport system protein Kup [Aromatoleum aromaticum EbN1]NMG55568.1 potassium transporter Kup [Aromatoleum aromaticum]CAI08171.1 Potassium uptake protein [Aromatoleum aromaticum EbN1]
MQALEGVNTSPAAAAAAHAPAPRRGIAGLAVAAVGVVYGDIGTSPLYTLKEVFNGPHAVPVTPQNVYGILSLVFWALVLVVSAKYVLFITRADNRGEGGIMALTSLVLRAVPPGRKAWVLSALGVFGAALFYGDGMITPAISVLSAVEGLEVATPAFRPYVLPIALAVLCGLFVIQRHGTGSVGRIFGPVMLVWFVLLAVLGIAGITLHPEIIGALDPRWALRFFADMPLVGWLSLGAVVLAITGGEALYADMGHFGRRPIKFAWFLVVFPSLYLNYLGQGALILDHPDNVRNPFYLLVPDALVYPMVAMATLATIIASQAVISGAYSLTRQAMQLGYAPRMRTIFTSEREMGQIYVPSINWMLLGAVVALVVGFRSSSALASAYGIAVTLTMMIDTLLAFVVVRALWGWGRLQAGLFLGVFLAVDVAFFSATTVKILAGGWFPLLVGALIFTLLTTWKRGRELLNRRLRTDTIPLDTFIRSMFNSPSPRVDGTAVFLTTWLEGVPRALLHNLVHNKVLHHRVVLLTVETADVPHVPDSERVAVEELDYGFYRVRVNYGFKDDPDLPAALVRCADFGLKFAMMETSFFLGRETLVSRVGSGMPRWREKLFIVMFRNAGSAADYFHIPPNRVVELGTQVEL